ncbi:MAG: tetratricopeptide repeat protein, partial [Myxococcota bacterium]|nr:tetratricopeptide repeat protein [Myxococcota bacterium]
MPRLSRVQVSVLAALMALLPSGVALGDDAATFQSLMTKAVQARDAGDLGRAATLLGEAYRIRPAPELLNNMGKLYEGQGRYADAVEVYTKVIASEDASAMLKTLDQTRIDLLSRKLGKAWIRTKGLPDGASVYVDGSPLEVDEEFDEMGADPGPRVLEWIAADGTTGAVHFLTLVAGKRTILDLAPAPASSA